VFLQLFETLGAKNTVNTDICCASEVQNHGIYDVVSSASKKTRYLQCFLDSTEQKHWYLRSFRHVARSFFHEKSHKNNVYKLQCLGSDFRVCDGVAGPEMNSNRLKKIR